MRDGTDSREIGGRKLTETRKTDRQLWRIEKSKQGRNGEEMDGTMIRENRRCRGIGGLGRKDRLNNER